MHLRNVEDNRLMRSDRLITLLLEGLSEEDEIVKLCDEAKNEGREGVGESLRLLHLSQPTIYKSIVNKMDKEAKNQLQAWLDMLELKGKP